MGTQAERKDGSADSSLARNGQVPGRAEEDRWIGFSHPLATLIALRTMTFSANSSPVALDAIGSSVGERLHLRVHRPDGTAANLEGKRDARE